MLIQQLRKFQIISAGTAGGAIRQLAARLNWPAVLAFGLPFALYNLTLAPTIYNLDSAELTTAVATGGILRATGYPLYLVLGRLWSLIPLGDMGYRMNLFSAFWGATTIFLADRILRRLRVGIWARIGALGLLATAQYFWSLSLIAEVYTLHTALMAAIILFLLRWGENPGPTRLALVIFLMAVSLGNHAATVLLVPGCVWYVITRHPRQLLRLRVYLLGGLAILLGAAVFLYLPIRYGSDPAFNYAGRYDASGTFLPVDLQSLDGILWLITGRTFAGQMFGYRLAELWPQVLEFGQQLWVAFFVVGLAPAILGLFALLRRDRSLGGMLALLFLANAIFYLNYRVIDKATMYLPTFLVWAVWLGYGYHLLLKWLQDGETPKGFAWLVRGVMIAGVAAALAWNWPRVDLSDEYSTREKSETILQIVDPQGMVFGWWDTIPAIQYLQLVEGKRPDVKLINRFLISGEDMNQLILNEIEHRSIYIDNPSVALLRTTRATRVGPLYRLELRK